MKKEIEYIIKKIIIGVGIAVGIMFIKQCPIFAAEVQDYAVCSAARGSGWSWTKATNDCSRRPTNDSDYKEYFNYKFSFYSSTFHFKSETAAIRKYVLFYDEKNEYYVVIVLSAKGNDIKITKRDISYYLYHRESTNEEYKSANFSFVHIISSKEIDKFEELNNLKVKHGDELLMNKQKFENQNEKIFFYNINIGNLYEMYYEYSNYGYDTSILEFENMKVISTNVDNIYVGDEKKEVEELTEIPQNYELIDMNGKEGILFYPKDYRNIEKTCAEGANIITGTISMCTNEDNNYKFYIKGSFDVAEKNMSLDLSENNRETLEIYSDFTKYERVVKHNYYDIGILFYTTTISSGVGGVLTNDNKIYYDSEKLNYVMIETIKDFTGQEISYIDKNGDTINTKIEGIKERTEIELKYKDEQADKYVNYNEESINMFNIGEKMQQMSEKMSNGFGFFKMEMSKFMKMLPIEIYLFIIFVPIIIILKTYIKNI